MSTDRSPRARDAAGRFLPTAQGRALVVRPEEPQPGESLMVSEDPDSRHLFLSWLWLGGAIVVAHWLYGLPLALDCIVILGAGFSVFFNLCLWCGKRWPKVTTVVLIILSGIIGGGRRRW